MKKVLTAVLALVLLLSLCACGSSSTSTDTSADTGSDTAATGEKVVLKLSSTLSTDDLSHTYLLKACDEIYEQTDGMLEIQFYPNAELGGLKDNIEQIIRGAEIIAFADPGYIAEFIPDFGVLTGPYLYTHYSDMEKIVASDWYSELCDTASDAGIKVFSMNWYLGSRHYIGDRALTSIEEFSGVLARSQSFEIAIQTTSAMGATPITMDFAEVYTGLSQGTIQASESPLSGIYNAKWQEAAKHLSLTQHFMQIVPLSMSQEVFDSLSPEYQEILVAAFDKYSIESNEAIAAAETEWLEKFEAEGVEIHEVSDEALAEFQEACASVYDTVDTWTPGLYETVSAIIAG